MNSGDSVVYCPRHNPEEYAEAWEKAYYERNLLRGYGGGRW